VRNALWTVYHMTKEIIIDGNNFSTLLEFYDEVENKLTKGLDWRIGRNLDAFNDVLRGGFGVHEYDEPIRIKWVNSDKSKRDLGHVETVKYIEDKLKKCHPTNMSSVGKDLELAKEGKGQMLFDIIHDIVRGHENIELRFA
jgi:RNAse (barnase) inhibitor barstar